MLHLNLSIRIQKLHQIQNEISILESLSNLIDVPHVVHHSTYGIFDVMLLDVLEVIVGDIKPDNLLLKSNGKTVIIDYGTARHFNDNSKCSGTLNFRSLHTTLGHAPTTWDDLESLAYSLLYLLLDLYPGRIYLQSIMFFFQRRILILTKLV